MVNTSPRLPLPLAPAMPPFFSTCGMCIILEKPSRKCVISPRLPLSLPGAFAGRHAAWQVAARQPGMHATVRCVRHSLAHSLQQEKSALHFILFPPSPFLPAMPGLGQHRHRVMAKHIVCSAVVCTLPVYGQAACSIVCTVILPSSSSSSSSQSGRSHTPHPGRA